MWKCQKLQFVKGPLEAMTMIWMLIFHDWYNYRMFVLRPSMCECVLVSHEQWNDARALNMPLLEITVLAENKELISAVLSFCALCCCVNQVSHRVQSCRWIWVHVFLRQSMWCFQTIYKRPVIDVKLPSLSKCHVNYVRSWRYHVFSCIRNCFLS